MFKERAMNFACYDDWSEVCTIEYIFQFWLVDCHTNVFYHYA